MMGSKLSGTLCVAMLTAALGVPAVVADEVNIEGGEVNISGATLFRNFFESSASTNDYNLDVDGDGCSGYQDPDPECLTVDQLAPLYACPIWPPAEEFHNGWWLVQYRGVGSVNGLREFVENQLLCMIPTDIPSEVGLINRITWAEEGVCSGLSCDCIPNEINPETCCDSCTPYCPTSIDLAVLDVPVLWGVRVDEGDGDTTAKWDRKPGDVGYGANPGVSYDESYGQLLVSLCRDMGGETVCLNGNVEQPDENTIFDTPIAWVPISFIANRRTGLMDVNVTDLQHLYVSGRWPTGENLVGATRDAGSGTRNGAMNSIGVDPSWGRGDNLGAKARESDLTNLGPEHRASNCGGSSIMENGVTNRGLAVGYTGLAGSSRAARDLFQGKYEILNVAFDDRGGDTPVRPTIGAVVYNDDVNSGWQVGGPETFASLGDINETDPEAPAYVDNQAAADYLRNIVTSVQEFVEEPGAPENELMPGQLLALDYFLLAGVSALPQRRDPSSFVTNEDLNTELQDYIATNNDLGWGAIDTPAFGSANEAGLVPKRNASPDWPDEGAAVGTYPADGMYADGSTTGEYANFDGVFNVSANAYLNERNQLMGDFNNDGARNWLDAYDYDNPSAGNLVQAYDDPRAFVAAEGLQSGDPGDLGQDYVIPEIIGDFNGDGNFGRYADDPDYFDDRDLRYFADGLAIDPVTGILNRHEGFKRVDDAYIDLTDGVDNNFFGTALATGATYEAGDSVADIAGADTMPYPGAEPNGHDYVVDAYDIDYVRANFGNFRILDMAVDMDLSADMNGDLIVNQYDVDVVVRDVLDTEYGDVNLDGTVDQADTDIINANLGMSGGWAMGDMNGDGMITEVDLGWMPFYPGDANCDGLVNNFDIDCFVTALTGGEAGWSGSDCAGEGCGFGAVADTNFDGLVNNFDIDTFVELLTN